MDPIFGFIGHKINSYLINHILLIPNYYAYKAGENSSLDLKVLERNIHKIKNIEKQISLNRPEIRKNLEAIVGKHIARILKDIMVQQLGWGRGNVVVVFCFFYLQYVVSFYTSCVVTAVLKTDA